MAPEANAFQAGYSNPTAKYGERTYVTVQGLNIVRKAKEGPIGTAQVGSFWSFGNLTEINLPLPGSADGDAMSEQEAMMEGAA
tara:strand:+ start:792 stop:1040 length:249 start_codon:yes stop_codon:yes gene_type:complete